MLQLITGDPDTHDWWYLLNKMNIIEYDDLVGNIFFTLSLGVLWYVVVVFYKDIKDEVLSLKRKK